MGGALRKTMIYLGLAEDDDRYDDDVRRLRGRRAPRRTRALEDRAASTSRRAPVTPIARGQVARVVRATRRAAELHRITTIHPRTYNEAKTIGESFRAGTPVIMNLDRHGRLRRQAAGRLRRRAGLRPARLDRAGDEQGVPALPANVEVAPAEKVRVPERGFFNQS